MNSVVIIPTYNEAENLPGLVEAIFAQNLGIHVLVVDDNSPDGTGKIADQLSKRYPGELNVLHRPGKEGLGKAYLHAFQYALDNQYDRIIQMDSDFSHPTSLLPQLLKGLEKYDFVLGSRYVQGGGTQDWGWIRKMIAYAGNQYAKLILNQPVKDLTGGFKGYNRRVVKFLLSNPLESVGYNFQIETTTRAVAEGFSYQEIPFVFKERCCGSSKMSKDIVIEALLRTWQLRKSIKAQKASQTQTAAPSLLTSNE